jgi:RNA polymerase sigma-70 factor (ECF subfamily)
MVVNLRSAPAQVATRKRPRPDSRLHRSTGAGAKAVGAASAVYWSPRKKVELYPFDAEYLRLLRDQDPATQSHFVSYFTQRFTIKLRCRGFTSPTLEDVSQETFYRVLIAVQNGTVHSAEKFGAYVSAVCDNVILEKYREFARNQHLDLDGMDIPDRTTNLEAAVLRREEKRIVAEVLEELPPKKRNILRALLYEQLDREQMCERFGVNSDYLRVLLFRAREDFAALLKARGLDRRP